VRSRIVGVSGYKRIDWAGSRPNAAPLIGPSACPCVLDTAHGLVEPFGSVIGCITWIAWLPLTLATLLMGHS
jgi:hypothetical protein